MQMDFERFHHNYLCVVRFNSIFKLFARQLSQLFYFKFVSQLVPFIKITTQLVTLNKMFQRNTF
jgi:hypothetical protein